MRQPLQPGKTRQGAALTSIASSIYLTFDLFGPFEQLSHPKSRSSEAHCAFVSSTISQPCEVRASKEVYAISRQYQLLD